MGNTQVGKLHRNKVVKDLNGNIIDWFDEANGGWIVRGRQVVNKERWAEEVMKAQDRAEAAKAAANPKMRDDYPETKDGATVSPPDPKPDAKVLELEKQVKDMDAKLEAILKAVQK